MEMHDEHLLLDERCWAFHVTDVVAYTPRGRAN
jgi:hypothetical protein